jgi:hypothetical protein
MSQSAPYDRGAHTFMSAIASSTSRSAPRRHEHGSFRAKAITSSRSGDLSSVGRPISRVTSMSMVSVSEHCENS